MDIDGTDASLQEFLPYSPMKYRLNCLMMMALFLYISYGLAQNQDQCEVQSFVQGCSDQAAEFVSCELCFILDIRVWKNILSLVGILSLAL